ncbi:MAG: esterase-like activity of phytase family protein [Burkholderiales bacterium]|nr:esterase-like activity of phytase family protein [Burkholderiales bacterium]
MPTLGSPRHEHDDGDALRVRRTFLESVEAHMRWTFRFRADMCSTIVVALLCLAVSANASAQLRYIGQQIVPTGYIYSDTVVGGLSGIDFDPHSGQFYAISDDRSPDARFYTLTLDLTRFNRRLGPGMAGVRFTGVHPLLDQDGTRFTGRRVDPEAIRLHPHSGTLLWTSEGNARRGAAPFVREMNTAGEPLREFELPSQYLARSGQEWGVRDNLAFESIAVTPSGRSVVVAVENALLQDGPAASRRSGSACRVLVFDHDSGSARAQFVYQVDAVVAPSLLPNGLKTNGLAELLALDEDLFVAVERSFSAGSRLSIRLYLTRTAGATDVAALDALHGASYQVMHKSLLLDLTDLTNEDGSALWLDNIEAISFGPRLENGNRTLILVADNNFSNGQQTQFLAFEITRVLH